MKKYLPYDTITELADLQAQVTSQKRNFSAFSSEESRAPQQFKGPAANKAKQEDEKSVNFEECIRIRENERSIYERQLKILHNLFQEGSLPQGEFEQASQELFQQAARSSGYLATARNHRNLIIGSISGHLKDMHRWNRSQELDDWHLVDNLIRRFRDVPGAIFLLKGLPRKDVEQARFRKELLHYYDAHDSMAYCCISGRFMGELHVVAAYLVAHNLGEQDCVYMFGKAPDHRGHLMHPRNGLILHWVYEAWLDNTQIVIVPLNPAEFDGMSWKVRVLDETIFQDPNCLHLRELGAPCSLEDLDGRVLSFPNENRPGASYVYFNFAISLLRRQRSQLKGWSKHVQEWDDQPVWVTPEESLRISTLHTIANRLGHIFPDRAALKLPKRPFQEPGYDAEHDILVADLVQSSSQSPRQSPRVNPLKHRFKKDQDEDEDQDEDQDEEQNDDGGRNQNQDEDEGQDEDPDEDEDRDEDEDPDEDQDRDEDQGRDEDQDPDYASNYKGDSQ